MPIYSVMLEGQSIVDLVTKLTNDGYIIKGVVEEQIESPTNLQKTASVNGYFLSESATNLLKILPMNEPMKLADIITNLSAIEKRENDSRQQASTRIMGSLGRLIHKGFVEKTGPGMYKRIL